MKRWLSRWEAVGDESWGEAVWAALVYVLLMVAFPALIWLVGTAVTVKP